MSKRDGRDEQRLPLQRGFSFWAGIASKTAAFGSVQSRHFLVWSLAVAITAIAMMSNLSRQPERRAWLQHRHSSPVCSRPEGIETGNVSIVVCGSAAVFGVLNARGHRDGERTPVAGDDARQLCVLNARGHRDGERIVRQEAYPGRGPTERSRAPKSRSCRPATGPSDPLPSILQTRWL